MPRESASLARMRHHRRMSQAHETNGLLLRIGFESNCHSTPGSVIVRRNSFGDG